jgi:hypothetical protein
VYATRDISESCAVLSLPQFACSIILCIILYFTVKPKSSVLRGQAFQVMGQKSMMNQHSKGLIKGWYDVISLVPYCDVRTIDEKLKH